MSVPQWAFCRAAEVHSGAMVALRPSPADAERLAVEGGEPGDQLHATLAYLGKAADIPPEVQQAIIAAVSAAVAGLPALTVDGFAPSVFQPDTEDSCITLVMSGPGLHEIHERVDEVLTNLSGGPGGYVLPEQYDQWIPHVSLIYTSDVAQIGQAVDRVGSITFDAVRIAFGGEITDIPLGAELQGRAQGFDPDDLEPLLAAFVNASPDSSVTGFRA